MSKYYITNDLWTVSGLELDLESGSSDEGNPNADVWLKFGPLYGRSMAPGNCGVWIATNGDPVLMATYDHDQELLWDASDEEWFEDALSWFGFDDMDDVSGSIESALEN